MKNQFEIVNHPHIKHINLFMVNMDYRSSHLHNDLELILILDGEVKITSKQESYLLTSDSMVIFNSNQPHEIHASKSGSLLLCLQVSQKFCTQYFSNISNLIFDSFNVKQNLSEKYYNYIKDLLIKIAHQYYSKKDGYEFSCIGMINLLFYTFLQFLPYRIISNDEKIATMRKVDRLNRILNYIDENYMNKLSLSDIAERENLSMSYLSHFIRDNLNQSFQQYVNNYRFNQAKKLLLNKDMNLIDILLECGFSDYRYLYKAFRENYNCTPNEYRKLYSKNNHEINIQSPLSSENFYTPEHALNILEEFDKTKELVIKL